MPTNYLKHNIRVRIGAEMQDQFDDSNWREELIPYTNSKKELELLENGPKSLCQSWYMNALHSKWMKIKGYKYPEPPNLQSNFMEFEKYVHDLQVEMEN
jgi:hypothetical protein